MRFVATTLLCCVVYIAAMVVVPSPIRAAQTSAFERSTTATVTAPHAIKVTQSAAPGSRSLGVLQPGDRVLVEGRDDKATWLYVESTVGSGYVAASTVTVERSLDAVPVVVGDLPTPTLPEAAPVDDAARFPILPEVSDFTRTIYQRGQAAGVHADVFTKVGDCMTADNLYFLGKFGSGDYQLGNYDNLQEVISYYSQTPVAGSQENSFVWRSQAALTGFNAASVEDANWTDPKVCKANETPLTCEYRLSKPGIAIIMFGTNDISALTSRQFDFFLPLVVHDTITHGTIPLLSTFPGSPVYEKKSHQFNQIIFQVARDYDVPVMNLWLAIQPLPGNGRNAESAYLTRPPNTEVATFTDANLRYGYTMRNLVTLQALDTVWSGVIHRIIGAEAPAFTARETAPPPLWVHFKIVRQAA